MEKRSGWLCYTEAEAVRNAALIRYYESAARQRGITWKLILRERLQIETAEGENRFFYRENPWKEERQLLAKPDFAVCRIMDPAFRWTLELAGIRVFNSAWTASVCNEKALTYQYVAAHGIETMDTWYDSRQCAEKGYPVVAKPVDGSGGKGVMLLKSEMEKEEALSGPLSGRTVVFQKVASEPGKDLRVYVLGDQIVAGMLRQSNCDFRSNFTLGGSASPYSFSEEERCLVQRIIRLFDFGLVGIDFVFDRGKLVFNEIEDVVGARMLYTHTEIDIADRYLEWILKRL